MNRRRVRARGTSGTSVVVVLVLVGLLAGVLAWVYWTYGVRVPAASQPAAVSTYDREAALVALDQAAVKVNAALAQPQVTPATVQMARELVSRYPHFPEARTLLAQVLLRAGDAEAAYEQVARSLELAPRQTSVQELAGAIASNLGRLDVAAGHFAAAAACEPNATRYRLSLANVLLKQGRLDSAQQQLRTIIRLNAQEHRAYALLADVYAQGDQMVEALAQVERALEHTPEEDRHSVVTYTRKRALLLRRAGRPREALQAFVSLYPVERQDPLVLADIAAAWDMLGQPGQAAAVYEQAATKDPTAWRLLAEAARWHDRDGDRPAVERCLKMVRLLNPHAPVLDELAPDASVAQPATQAPVSP